MVSILPLNQFLSSDHDQLISLTSVLVNAPSPPNPLHVIDIFQWGGGGINATLDLGVGTVFNIGRPEIPIFFWYFLRIFEKFEENVSARKNEKIIFFWHGTSG